MPSASLGIILKEQLRIASETQQIKARLSRAKKPNSKTEPKAWETVAGIWRGYDLTTRKARAWESLNVLRAIYLFGISLKDISRRGRVAYRTVQYFVHSPNMVGIRSASKIVLATKLLMADTICHIEEPLESVYTRWHDCDPRKIPKSALKTLNSGIRTTLREKERTRTKKP